MKKVGEKRYVVTVEEYEKEPDEIEFENRMSWCELVPCSDPPKGIVPGVIQPDDDDEEDFIDDDWDDEDFEDEDDEEYEELVDPMDDIERIHQFYAGKYNNNKLIPAEMMDDHIYDILAKKRRR